MSSYSNALGSVFGTLASVAGAIGSTANTLTTGVESINDWATNARQEQQLKLALSRKDYANRLREEMSEQITKRRARILEFTAQSQQNKDLYDAAYAELTEALEAHLNPTGTKN